MNHGPPITTKLKTAGFAALCVAAAVGLFACASADSASEGADPNPNADGSPGVSGITTTRTLSGAKVIRSSNYTMVLTVGTHDLTSKRTQGEEK